jgi:putative ABC transport system ATP-binding protein
VTIPGAGVSAGESSPLNPSSITLGRAPAEGSAAPIVVSRLNHWYGEHEARKQVLFDLDLVVERGTLTILEGASGSGKTTLLTLLGCLRRVEDGNVGLLGQELREASEELLVESRLRLGFIFQAHNLHGSLTALQNVRMGVDVHGGAARGRWREAGTHLLGMLGLADRLDYLPGQLSGGQRQRVAVARALIGNPEIVFADEPTAALDKESAVNVVLLLKRLARERGTTTLLVTHDSKIRGLADRLVTLEDGRIVDDRRIAPAGDR